MSIRRRLRALFVCAVLEAGALLGSPMRFEELEAIMRALHGPVVTRNEVDEDESGEPPEAGDTERPGHACAPAVSVGRAADG